MFKKENARKSRTIVLQFLAFALIIFGIKLWVIGSFGNSTPFWDQWDAEAENLYRPYLEGTLSWADLFSPHNEHRIFTTRLLSLILLNINGIWNPVFQMIVNAILHIGSISLAILFLSRITEHRYLHYFLLFSALAFGFPYAWENTLAGFQAQFYFLLIFSTSCLWLTTTQKPFSLFWWGGLLSSGLAFFSLGSGVFALAGASFANLMLVVSGQRRSWKQVLSICLLSIFFLIGVYWTPIVSGHAVLKAKSIGDLGSSLMAVLSWPIPPNVLPILLMNFPAILFTYSIVTRPPPANDRRWFLVGFLAFFYGQVLSICYGRFVGNLSSRYLDLFAFSILANFACLFSIYQGIRVKNRQWLSAGIVLWAVVILSSIGYFSNNQLRNQLPEKRDLGVEQEKNTRNYLATGDMGHLINKPFLQAPYPDTERLVKILSSKKLREILPGSIRLEIEQKSAANLAGDTFVEDGYYPITPKYYGKVFGSYGPKVDKGTGEFAIQYEADQDGGFLIPVAGYPMNDGSKIEIEQNGKIYPLIVDKNPGEKWKKFFFKVKKGTFVIHVTDSSEHSWLSVGAPTATGRFDLAVDWLLKYFWVFILAGSSLGFFLIGQGLQTLSIKFRDTVLSGKLT